MGCCYSIHNTNQVLFGIVLGLCLLTIFKFVFQKLLYDLCWGFLTKEVTQKRRLFTIMVIKIVCFIISIIFYAALCDYHLLPQKDIDNLNRTCSSNRTALDIQAQIFNGLWLEELLWEQYIDSYFCKIY